MPEHMKDTVTLLATVMQTLLKENNELKRNNQLERKQENMEK